MNPARQKSIIIAAHPDDEVLWFSSVLDKADAIVICFLDIAADPQASAGRRRCIADYPIGNVKWLEMGEAGCFGLADWRRPVVSRWGIRIPDKPAYTRYRENYGRLAARFKTILQGYQVAYTHNPWGEYGHEEHVQVYTAVKTACGRLPEAMRPEIRCPLYASGRSAPLMLASGHIFKNPYVNLRTNTGLALQLKQLYEKNGCWTWFPDWQWPTQDNFVLASRSGQVPVGNTNRSVPVQFIDFPG